MIPNGIAFILHFFMAVQLFLFQPHFAVLPKAFPPLYQDSQILTLPTRTQHAQDLPSIQADAYLIIDAQSAEVFAEKNPDISLAPASTTKIMTAMVVLNQMNLDQIITMRSDAMSEGSVMHLVAGERLRVRDVLAGMLIHSGNDAATQLAYAYPGGYLAFIDAMNAEANQLHMTHTHYQNPTGLIEAGHYTTVRDLLILSRYAMQNSTFSTIVKEKELDIVSVDGKFRQHVGTTNVLLGNVDGVEGIKTGWTEEAGECLVTQVTRKGHTVLIALLHSPDRFGETIDLINWVFSNYVWQTKSLTDWIH